MIEVNLLPDIKREYLQAKQTKHLFIVGSVLVTIITLSSLALFFGYVQVVQPRHRANVQKDIDSSITALKAKPDAVKIITTQGVLEQIPALQDKKLVTSRLFQYLTEFTPRNVSYSEIRFDSATKTMSLTGQTNTLERANVLANNLKSAEFTYTQNDAKQKLKPFTSVVFSSLGKSQQSTTGDSVGFQISFQIDTQLFSQQIKDQKISVNASSEELLLPSSQPFNEQSAGSQ